MMPPSWLTGDQNGLLKLITCEKATKEQLDLKHPAIKYQLSGRVLKRANADPAGPATSVQKLSVGTHSQNLVSKLQHYIIK